MKNQALFFSKDKSNKLKCPLLQFLYGTLRLKQNLTLKMKLLSHISPFLAQITVKILNIGTHQIIIRIVLKWKCLVLKCSNVS